MYVDLYPEMDTANCLGFSLLKGKVLLPYCKNSDLYLYYERLGHQGDFKYDEDSLKLDLDDAMVNIHNTRCVNRDYIPNADEYLVAIRFGDLDFHAVCKLNGCWYTNMDREGYSFGKLGVELYDYVWDHLDLIYDREIYYYAVPKPEMCRVVVNGKVLEATFEECVKIIDNHSKEYDMQYVRYLL